MGRDRAVIDKRILICAVASVLGHFALGEALSTLPERKPPVYDRKLTVTVIQPEKQEPPPPEPPKPPEPEPKPEPNVVREKVARPVQATVHDTIAKDVPIANHAVVVAESAAQPVFGVTMESTSTGGTGGAVPVGNTTAPQPGAAPTTTVKPPGTPVAAYEVTKMPLPQGRCSGKYTEEARTAALEGVVVLDLIVDEKGRARDIKVVSGLEHGLTEAAITAIKECTFSPGEQGGQPVAVRVRGFKIRFVMADAQ